MLRKRLSRWAAKSDGEQPLCAFTENFWLYYIECLDEPVHGDHADILPPNPKKYTSSSTQVSQVRDFFGPEYPLPSNSQIIALLKSPFTQGDIVKAFHLIRFFQLSECGYFITNDGFERNGAPISLQGAENWEHVVCYLDALLFAMFANLESFEPILFLSNQHSNPLITQLLGLLRVHVNLLRLGNLITTDITRKICECLCKLGFQDALSHHQQDCAPLFEFLTENLSMPLLTFRVQIQHSGKHDDDDMKYLKERILFVSIPEDDSDSEDDTILLEECLEHYFNNSISVKRELQRRATLEELLNATDDALPSDADAPKSESSYVVRSNSSLAMSKAPSQGAPGTSGPSPAGTQPQARARSSTLSFWSISSKESKPREVILPAWMLLRLLPFYTDDNDTNKCNESIARNTHEFANRRPVLPICLKRYSFAMDKSHGVRSLKRIIIPPVIDLPAFVADCAPTQMAPTQSFKLILESAICHRGKTIESGHFVSVARKNTHVENETLEESLDATWYLYDDLKASRVVTKKFKDVFESEWPYMLFYRLVAVDGVGQGNSSHLSLDSTKSSVMAPRGHKPSYWVDDQLTPILSPAEDHESGSVNTVPGPKLAPRAVQDSMDPSVPIPPISPNSPNFVDIRKRYLWYITDKEKNYYKESASASKKGSRNMSICFTPQFRRNSQWSDYSNPSALTLEGGTSIGGKYKLDPDDLKNNLEKIVLKTQDALDSETLREGKLPKHEKKAADTIKNEEPRERLRHHIHHIFSHEKDRPPSLTRSHIKKKRVDYKNDKCVIS